jgi:hypothetical protein
VSWILGSGRCGRCFCGGENGRRGIWGLQDIRNGDDYRAIVLLLFTFWIEFEDVNVAVGVCNHDEMLFVDGEKFGGENVHLRSAFAEEAEGVWFILVVMSA